MQGSITYTVFRDGAMIATGPMPELNREGLVALIVGHELHSHTHAERKSEAGNILEVTDLVVRGKDLRHVFDRPEYRVMLVANKFQTGFDQPKLVAMYVDKKIANAVEIVQTFSRLNRAFPGKDQTFTIDFINDADVVQAAFAQYDRGARIEEVQDLNVIYDLKVFLDDHGFYDVTDVLDFQRARFCDVDDADSRRVRCEGPV